LESQTKFIAHKSGKFEKFCKKQFGVKMGLLYVHVAEKPKGSFTKDLLSMTPNQGH